MNKIEFETQLLRPKLKQGEEIIGFFQAMNLPSIGLHLLVGILAALSTKTYYIAVTNQGIHVYQLTLLGKLDVYKFIAYSDITNIKIGTGFLQAPFEIILQSGEKVRVKAKIKGLEAIAKLDDKTKAYLLSKYPLASNNK